MRVFRFSENGFVVFVTFVVRYTVLQIALVLRADRATIGATCGV
jgi:hypothetical protein